jgi:VWFA-related protein
MVEVDVIAKDKRGNPVPGLAEKDFTLFDDGREQKFARFAVEQGTPEKGSVPNDPQPKTRPGQGPTFSNTHAESPAPAVILFDQLNTSMEDQALMKGQLLQALTRVKQGTPIALLALGDGLSVISDFTTSTAALTKAAENWSARRAEGFGPAMSVRQTGRREVDVQVSKLLTRGFRAEVSERVALTMTALNVISQQLGRIQGRKSLLWVTDGLDVTRDSAAVQTAIEKLMDANVAVYTVDARGVLLDPGIGADSDFNDLVMPERDAFENARDDVLADVAQRTGGVFYHNTNWLDDAIAQAIEDRSVVYVLDYYPQHDDWQGRFHKIEVRTSLPGVRLRYRSGYLATPPAPSPRQDQQQTVAAILASPLEFSGIRFSVEIRPDPGRSGSTLVLHVPAEEVRWSPQNEKMVSTLQMWFIQRGASGEDLATKTAKAEFRLPTDQYLIAARQGINLGAALNLQPAAAKVRVLLQDISSGQVGTVDVPIDPISPPAAH